MDSNANIPLLVALQKPVSHSPSVVSTVSFAKATMPNELVQVHLVRVLILLVDGWEG